jgi:NAD(P)-dependent dehydrogenase (short-subunit alcohol dehydrogenase family)
MGDGMKKWLVTGVSSGLGRALAQEVLANCDTVYGTVRTDSDLQKFEALHPERAIGLMLDLQDNASIPEVIRDAEKRSGGLDVLVNNAGYGLIGAVEEFTIEELRTLFEVNFFGAFSCIRAVLPAFRRRRSGHIVNITSVSGLAPWAGTAAYGASKYALEGLGQTLAKEMQEFGVKVTNVEPGGIDTDFATRSLSIAHEEIAEYRNTAAHVPRQVYSQEQSLPGDAGKVARAIIAIVGSDDPPVQLLLGEDAVHYAEQQMTEFTASMTKWMTLTTGITR